jgi:hypothetical protein
MTKEMWLVHTRHLLRQIWRFSYWLHGQYWLFNFICFSEQVVWFGRLWLCPELP